jgi:septum site-determining protein MinC
MDASASPACRARGRRVAPERGGEFDYEQAGELKIGQVGIANLRIRTLDANRLAGNARARRPRAEAVRPRRGDPRFRRPVPTWPPRRRWSTACAAGVLPVALAYGTSAVDLLSQQLGLPLLAKFRASTSAPNPRPRRRGSAEPAPPPVAAARPGRQARPDLAGALRPAGVRRKGDLTVMATVGAGAEVIADGSIHIYGTCAAARCRRPGQHRGTHLLP